MNEWTLACAAIFLLMAAQALAEPIAIESATPQSQGMSAEKLDAAAKDLFAHGTVALIVMRHDRIVLERYGPSAGADVKHYTASLAKAIVGGTTLAFALEDKRCSLDDPASRFIPQWRTDPLKSKITLRQLATHTSGIEDAELDDLPHEKLPGWKGAFWKRDPDPFTISRDQAPVLFEPGTKLAYSNPGMAMLAYAVTAAYRDTDTPDLATLLRKRLMRPLGIPDNQWSVGYGAPSNVDGLKLVANWGGGAYAPRATARVGQFLLHQGRWDGRQILSKEIVQALTTYSDKVPLPQAKAGDPAPAPALGFWCNANGAWKNVPRDAYCGAGAGHQILLVIPSLDMVVVRNGGAMSAKGESFWHAAERWLIEPIANAVSESAGAPYPRSPLIHSVEFDPIPSVTRKAIGSDNWPITWADDDRLYTSYGDGWGFEPTIKEKLSMGFARIEGNPPDLRAENIRSATGERKGNGPRGAKASGLLCVDGTLYMWVRNTKNATLVSSTDHGLTWNWHFTLDESFGCPTFMNAGRNYADALDEYVYTCSPDGETAYEPADGLVLARVHRARITSRDSYEFFAGLDSSGSAQWSKDIAGRKPIFAYAGHCERPELIYHPRLKRCLLVLSYGHGRGFGIFDAPHPWGAWTTAMHAENWDIPGVHGYRLPTKWISSDGLSMVLLFSGLNDYDAFCLRGMRLRLN